MNQTFLELNYWAWLGFIFLLLAGICSAIATKTTTRILINKSTDKTIKQTSVKIDEATGKILHPLIDLYDFTVKEHKLNNDDLLGQIQLFNSIYNAINERKKGNEIIQNGEKASTPELYSIVKIANGKISDLYNKNNSLSSSLKILITNTNNSKIHNLFEQYKLFIKEMITLKNNIEEPNFNYRKLDQKIKETHRKHFELIEIINLEKYKILNKV